MMAFSGAPVFICMSQYFSCHDNGVITCHVAVRWTCLWIIL